MQLWIADGVGEHADLLPFFCTAVKAISGVTITPTDVVSDAVSFVAFAEKLGMPTYDAHFALAKKLMARGVFFPHVNLLPNELPNPTSRGLYRLERYHFHDADIPSSLCLLLIDRPLQRPVDHLRATYVRMYVPTYSRTGADPKMASEGIASFLEYEGLMTSVGRFHYFLFQSTDPAARDMAFMIAEARGEPIQALEGQYTSVHVEQGFRPESRFVKITHVTDTISDTSIRESLATIQEHTSRSEKTAPSP